MTVGPLPQVAVMTDNLPDDFPRLMGAAQRGVSDAQDRLFRALQRRFFAIALRVFEGNWNDAEDGVQASFIKLYRNLHRINPSNSPWAYCSVLCSNTCRTLRSRNRGPQSIFIAVTADDLSSMLAGDEPDPGETLLQREADEQAIALWNEVIEQTDETTRRIVRMRFRDDLTFQQIADQLQLSVAAVHQRLSRLCARMKAKYCENDLTIER